MKCSACNVYLNENASLCPLCNSPAEASLYIINGLAWQDYPDYRALVRGSAKPYARRQIQLSAWRSIPNGTLREELQARFGL